eukprot:CAMPEP_0169437392 /NCGR_PEP_ID=MMETSP1042-20121227/6106_1 /TAXON_ID=464988 /ORGANISM="Hemiselmis andersenii, Strain CCMP1180" /LENGTH=132 /DNA_ID=CAMNT_0009548167 /DNA_START=748 /DNA_END=1146 /DNA_ORIENTATION=-
MKGKAIEGEPKVRYAWCFDALLRAVAELNWHKTKRRRRQRCPVQIRLPRDDPSIGGGDKPHESRNPKKKQQHLPWPHRQCACDRGRREEGICPRCPVHSISLCPFTVVQDTSRVEHVERKRLLQDFSQILVF